MTTAPNLDAVEPYSIAATRDASWYNRPDVHKPKRYHVWGQDQMSACGRSILTDLVTRPLDGVPANLRCQARGCCERWPT
jgi:hypothetical protein